MIEILKGFFAAECIDNDTHYSIGKQQEAQTSHNKTKKYTRKPGRKSAVLILALTVLLTPSITIDVLASLWLPPGFSSTVWKSTQINGGSGITFGPYSGPGGGLRAYVTNAYWGQGAVVTIPFNSNGTGGSAQLFATGFEDQIVGTVYNPETGYWYSGHGSKISWMKDKNGNGNALDPGEKGDLLTNLTEGSGTLSKHAVGQLSFGPDGKLYFSVGSKSDVGEVPEPPGQATIRRVTLIDPETAGPVETVATGLRNASGHTWMTDGRLVATEHGPDCDFPDELNVIQEGGNYGFPYCYGFGTEQPPGCPIQTQCDGTIKPVATFTPHSAPIGIKQYTGTMFPLKYREKLFIAQFGNLVNWQDTSMGRRIVMAEPDSDDGWGAWNISDFFMDTNPNPFTREISWLVDLAVAPDGSLFVIEFSDQNLSPNSGTIWRITFNDPTPPTGVSVSVPAPFVGTGSPLNANWTEASDPESGIAAYWYAVGTSPGSSSLKAWTRVGLSTSVQIDDLNLSPGQTVYVSARAENGNLGGGSMGVLGPISSSPPVTVLNSVLTGDARLQSDEEPVHLAGKVVSAVNTQSGCFHIQEPDRSSGIRVNAVVEGLSVGDIVNVTGTLGTRMMNGHPSERQIESAVVVKIDAPSQPPIPLHMTGSAVGGAAVASELPGVAGGIGLNNIGLLVSISGQVTFVSGAYFWVDDGTGVQDSEGRTGVRVAAECPHSLSAGDVVTVTGVVEGFIPDGWTENTRFILTRTADDILKH